MLLLSIRYHGEIDHRGPLIIIVLWLTIFALSLVWLKTSLKYTYWPWALLNVIFNSLYAATLLPNGSATLLRRRNIDDVSVYILICYIVKFKYHFHIISHVRNINYF